LLLFFRRFLLFAGLFVVLSLLSPITFSS
jgi:hypothetical protein